VTDTETTAPEDESVAPVDDTELILYTWGLSGQPTSWAATPMQLVIATVRLANTGFADAAAVQTMLDASYPDAGYLAANVMLAHPPVGLMTDIEIEDLSIHGHLVEEDEDLDLPDENVTWYFDDGAIMHSASGFDHSYAGPGTYTITLTVAVAGVLYGDNQKVTVAPVGGGEPQMPPPEEVDDETPVPEEPEAYDPGAHTVDEVLAYVDEYPDQIDRIRLAEEAGKNRVGILDHI